MSIEFSFLKDKFYIKSLELPSRYRYFFDDENYIKLICLGDGLYPKDKVKTAITLADSSLILANESATKVYPSSKKFASNLYDIHLCRSNLEFINDELILYKNAKYRQNFTLEYDESSTFFYVDILSNGIDEDGYNYDTMDMKNIFHKDGKKEYMERYKIDSTFLKEYLLRMDVKDKLFVKFYIKTHDNDEFVEMLNTHRFFSFAFTQNRDILIGSSSFSYMPKLKKYLFDVWDLYREFLGKKRFELGKY